MSHPPLYLEKKIDSFVIFILLYIMITKNGELSGAHLRRIVVCCCVFGSSSINAACSN